MKKRLLFLLGLALLVLAATVSADTDGHERDLEDVVADIRRELGLRESDSIDPDRVPPRLLETLGDAVMSETHPDPDTHTWMDEMMGGEGSESLASAHRWMGYRYLSGGFGPGRGMAGWGMMGPGMMGRGIGRWGMMGNPDVEYGGSPFYSPRDIVERRYAEGDISREEYLQLLEDLSADADSR